MTRKDFLGYIGGLFLALLGIQQLIHLLSRNPRASGRSSQAAQGLNYGDSDYGGATRRL